MSTHTKIEKRTNVILPLAGCILVFFAWFVSGSSAGGDAQAEVNGELTSAMIDVILLLVLFAFGALQQYQVPRQQETAKTDDGKEGSRISTGDVVTFFRN